MAALGWKGRFRFFRVGLSFSAQIGLLLGLFVLAYLIVANHNRRLDLTKEKVHSLSPKSLEIVKGLGDSEIRIKAFLQKGDPAEEVLEQLLEQYGYVNPKIQYEFVDPNRKPGLAQAYRVDEFGTIVLEWGEKREKIKEISEEVITNALLKLSEFRKRKLFFVTGHGEANLESDQPQGYQILKGKLEDENYEVQEINLSRQPVPDDTDLLVIAGPKIDFLVEEKEAVKKYLDEGGQGLFLLDPLETEPFTRLSELVRAYGIELGRDFVVDKLSRLFGADYLIPVITQYEGHPITENFSLACFLPIAQSVKPLDKAAEGLITQSLALTSQGSWAEKSLTGLKEGVASFEEGVDLQGPVSLASVAERMEPPLRLVVFGDSDFANNSHLGLSGNKDLLLNSLAWAAGEEKLVTIRPKTRANTPLALKVSDQRLVFTVPVVVLPLCTLGAGVFVFLYRKRFH